LRGGAGPADADCARKEVDVVIIAEPYRHLDQQFWRMNATRKTAIWSCAGYPFREVMKRQESGFVWVKINGMYMYNCYTPPSLTLGEFEEIVDRLVNRKDAKDRNPCVVAGGRLQYLIGEVKKRTKETLLKALSVLNLTLLNDGKTPTFVKGIATSTIDLTFVNDGLSKGDTRWQVTDIYTHSDHCAIMWIVARQQRANQPSKRKPRARG